MVVELTSFYASSTLAPQTATPPTIRNIHVRNVSAGGAPAREAIHIVGLPELPIRDVSFENVEIVAEKGLHAADCKNVHFKATKLMSPSGEAFPSQDL
jgi:hypothetical protein